MLDRLSYPRSLPARARHWVVARGWGLPPLGGRRRMYRRFLTDLIKHTGNYADLTWLGKEIWQPPLDLWTLQEVIVELRPSVLLETGTNQGGSALFYAQLFDSLGSGRVITVDVERMHAHQHERVEFLVESSVDEQVLSTMREAARSAEGHVMVVLDSDHSAEHVFKELRAYGPLVTPGSLMLVQDGVIDTLPMYEAFRPGPLRAVESYLAETSEFEVDRRLEQRFPITQHPLGWLRRR